MADVKEEDAVLDCRGQQCPMPVVRLGREIGALGPGRVMKVLTTDRGAVTDVPAWAGDTGNELLRWYDNGDHLVFYIRRAMPES